MSIAIEIGSADDFIATDQFLFGPDNDTYIPQYGFSETVSKDDVGAPGFVITTITLSGAFRKITHIDNMNAYNALKAILQQHELRLKIVDDGVPTTIFDRTVHLESHNLPTEWNTTFTKFTIVLSYIDKTISALSATLPAYLCSFNAFVFDPMPVMSQSYTYNRNNPRSNLRQIERNITISGFFKEVDMNANLAKIEAADAALQVGGTGEGVFIYERGSGNGINSSAFVNSFEVDRQFISDIAKYTASFTIFTAINQAANIIEEDITISNRPNFPRFVAHRIPGLDGRTVLPLGLSHSLWSISGTIEATTLAIAQARRNTIIAANLPAGAILESQPTESFDPLEDNILTFQQNYSYDN